LISSFQVFLHSRTPIQEYRKITKVYIKVYPSRRLFLDSAKDFHQIGKSLKISILTFGKPHKNNHRQYMASPDYGGLCNVVMVKSKSNTNTFFSISESELVFKNLFVFISKY
jgi:hypothetical protein